MSEVPMGGFGAMAADEPDSTTGPGRDPRLIVGGLVGLLVLVVAGAYFLLGGGGGSGTPSPVAAPRTHVAGATTGPAVIPVATPTAPVKVFKGDVGRDPFQALVTPPPTKAATSAPAATTAPATGSAAPVTTPGSVVGTTGLPTSGPTLPVTTTPTAPATTTAPPQKVMVVLKAIAFHGTTPYVVVSYAGQQYGLKTGESAGSTLKVLAIAPDDGTATFQLGDQTFDLHIGQSYVD